MKRTRLSPETRREQLLDAAKRAIINDGLQQLSLKKLAVDAGVSEQLLFHYFSSRVDLLQQLLERDYTRYLDALRLELDRTSDLRDILDVYVTRNFDHHTEDSVLDILLAEPDIAVAVKARRSSHLKQQDKFLISAISSELGASPKMAAMLAVMGSAASMSAAKFAHENRLDRNDAIKSVIRFITKGFESATATDR